MKNLLITCLAHTRPNSSIFGIWLIKINKIAKKCYRRIYITPPYYILKRWMVATITATHTNRFTPHDRGEKSGFHPAGLWSWHIIPSSLLPISMEHTASYWLTSHTPPALALWKGETECREFLYVVTMVRLIKIKQHCGIPAYSTNYKNRFNTTFSLIEIFSTLSPIT